MPRFGTEGLRFTCQQTGHCCTARYDGYGYVYLGQHDRQRLAAHLGLTLEQLAEKHCQVTCGELHLSHPERGCQFLTGGRCTVYEARPTQCRTWPFWPENMKRGAWDEAARTCPGMGQGRLHTAEEIRAIVAETRRELADTAAVSDAPAAAGARRQRR